MCSFKARSWWLPPGWKRALWSAPWGTRRGAAVVALIIRAVHRIGGHALHDRWLWGIAIVAFVGELLGVQFALTLLVAGSSYVLVKRLLLVPAVVLQAVFVIGAVGYALSGAG